MTITWTLVSWLHVVCGLSQDSASKVLKTILLLISLALRAGAAFTSESSHDISGACEDVRTAMKYLGLKPKIRRSVCCPKCFSLYSLKGAPDICMRRKTSRAHPCNTSLWTMRHPGGGPSQRCPERLYSMQLFEPWLIWFLSRPGMEDIIYQSYEAQQCETMSDIHKSPAWHASLGSFCTTRGSLTFSLYVNWFNPLTNKIAGKKISCGAIIMCCLNLPPDLCYRPENTFFVGLTPVGKEPDVVTITNVLDPVMEQLLEFFTGKVIPTFNHPEGTRTGVAVLPFIGDVVAVQKRCGFASHSAKNFCSFCTCTLDEIKSLDVDLWRSRNNAEAWINSY